MGNRIRSAPTKMVNRKNMMKANIHAASKATLSGQLRFLGLFASSYFLSREIVVPTKGTGVADFFHLPNNCVIELGTRVQI